MTNHLMGLAEVAGLLGVSKQRVGQLIETYADFPEPVAELSGGRVWDATEVKLWMERRASRQSGRPTYPKLSPFDETRWPDDGSYEVRIDDTWYEFLAIDELPWIEISAFARARYQEKWRKRVDEDLVEILERLGRDVGDIVALRLRHLETGDEVVLGSQMTYERRQAIYFKRNEAVIATVRSLAKVGANPSIRRGLEAALDNARASVLALEQAMKLLETDPG